MHSIECKYCGKTSMVDLSDDKVEVLECPACGANISIKNVKKLIQPTPEKKEKNETFKWLFVVFFFLFVMGFILFITLLIIFCGVLGI